MKLKMKEKNTIWDNVLGVIFLLAIGIYFIGYVTALIPNPYLNDEDLSGYKIEYHAGELKTMSLKSTNCYWVSPNITYAWCINFDSYNKQTKENNLLEESLDFNYSNWESICFVKEEEYFLFNHTIYNNIPIIYNITEEHPNKDTKDCQAEVIIWKTDNRFHREINTFKDNFKIIPVGFEIDESKLVIEYSTDVSFEKNGFDKTIIKSNSWQKTEKDSELSENIILEEDDMMIVRFRFPHPKHQTNASWNFYYTPLNLELDPAIDSCGSLGSDDVTYTLNQSITTSAAFCMIITGDRVTLSLGGHTITGDGTNVGVVGTKSDAFVTGAGRIVNFDVGVWWLGFAGGVDNVIFATTIDSCNIGAIFENGGFAVIAIINNSNIGMQVNGSYMVINPMIISNSSDVDIEVIGDTATPSDEDWGLRNNGICKIRIKPGYKLTMPSGRKIDCDA